MDDISTHAMLDGAAAVFAVGILHVAAPLAIGLVTLVRAVRLRRSARSADASWVADAPLAAGPATIHGDVELAEGSDLALRTEIVQHGRAWTGKNGPEYAWVETDRKTESAPFYLREKRGGRVRVEPDSRALLVDEIDREVRKDESTRVAIAELSAGETVYVIGELRPARDPQAGAGYRGGDDALVMVSPPDGRLLVSTKPLGERFDEEALVHGSIALAAFGSAVFFAGIDAGYWTRLLGPRGDTGVVESLRKTQNKTRACQVTVAMKNGERFGSIVDLEYCTRLRNGDTVPISVGADSAFFAHVGASPAVHGAGLLVAVVVVGILAAALLMRGKRWYEGALVSESGTGPLLPPVPRA